ncbi:Uncharacterised protein [Bordetella pertussis]|nr:Uncharacterised protein [Bordetella pertussis]
MSPTTRASSSSASQRRSRARLEDSAADSVTFGTTAESASCTRPSLSMVSDSANPPSANRTVLPAWRASRSRAQDSRSSSAFSARAAILGKVGRAAKGSMESTGADHPRGVRSNKDKSAV